MTSLHPILLQLLQSSKDRVIVAIRKVNITGTGSEEVERETRHLDKVQQLFSCIQKILDEDKRYSISHIGSSNTFQEAIEKLEFEKVIALKQTEKILTPKEGVSYGEYYDELDKIEVPLMQPYKAIYFFVLVMFFLISLLLVGYILTVFKFEYLLVTAVILFLVNVLVGFVSFFSWKERYIDRDKFGYGLKEDNFRKNMLRKKSSDIKNQLLLLGKEIFTKSWFVNNLPANLINLLYYNLKISKEGDKVEVSAYKVDDSIDLAADALVSKLCSALKAEDCPYPAWTLTTLRSLDSSKCHTGTLVDNLPELDVHIKSLINSFVYVKLEIREKFTLIFLVSEQQVKSETWDGIKPMAGYSAEDIRSFLVAAEESEVKVRINYNHADC